MSKSDPAPPNVTAVPSGANTNSEALESAVQRKRRHALDPRLDEISAAVRSGRISLHSGMEQVVQVLGEVAGRVLRPEERLALEHAMRAEISHYTK
jgi:hypothetical protein